MGALSFTEFLRPIVNPPCHAGVLSISKIHPSHYNSKTQFAIPFSIIDSVIHSASRVRIHHFIFTLYQQDGHGHEIQEAGNGAVVLDINSSNAVVNFDDSCDTRWS